MIDDEKLLGNLYGQRKTIEDTLDLVQKSLNEKNELIRTVIRDHVFEILEDGSSYHQEELFARLMDRSPEVYGKMPLDDLLNCLTELIQVGDVKTKCGKYQLNKDNTRSYGFYKSWGEQSK